MCFRTFAVQSLDRYCTQCKSLGHLNSSVLLYRHKNVCQKVATKKRKVFDSSKQRVGDLPEVPRSPSPTKGMVPVSPLTRRQFQNTLKLPSWKEKHLNLIKTVREARGADSTRCPYCERYSFKCPASDLKILLLTSKTIGQEFREQGLRPSFRLVPGAAVEDSEIPQQL